MLHLPEYVGSKVAILANHYNLSLLTSCCSGILVNSFQVNSFHLLCEKVDILNTFDVVTMLVSEMGKTQIVIILIKLTVELNYNFQHHDVIS